MGNEAKYERGPFVVFYCGTGYIAQNTSKPFDEGHTHLRSFKACIDAINFVTHNKIPKRTGFYYLLSLKRLSTDANYIRRIDELIAVRKGKGKEPYYRPTKTKKR